MKNIHRQGHIQAFECMNYYALKVPLMFLCNFGRKINLKNTIQYARNYYFLFRICYSACTYGDVICNFMKIVHLFAQKMIRANLWVEFIMV